ncbi:class C beta-lactamase [Burkholderia alba]|uniref:class C beta-lactamase n=1 Tax=Burkholderia alba TaxID=2683677 RepID=UPI002B05AEBA|nr:class C beta-lactamase [Burkholderia alba]
MKLNVSTVIAAIAVSISAIPCAAQAADARQDGIRSEVDREIRPLMEKYRIPGVAVGIVADGQPYVFNYGVASTDTGKAVTRDTMFELGSVSKTLTATLATYAQRGGYLSLSDQTGKYLPSLQDSSFGHVSLMNLGTHTPGGLPLQVPDDIRNDEQLIRYFQAWRPAYAPGTYRTYANPSIGMLGLIAAKSMGQDFTALMQGQLLPALGMTGSYIDVPETRMADYAQGYTTEGAPIRMKPGMLFAEAYGFKATATDMIRFVQANMQLIKLDGKLQDAVTDTHTGYFKAGPMTQDLIWEQYPYPVSLKSLLKGNGASMIFDPTPVSAITPPQPPRQDVWINKTGSTNGFGSYVAFIPEKRLGIVILANKNFPIDDRVKAAYRILTTLDNKPDQ